MKGKVLCYMMRYIKLQAILQCRVRSLSHVSKPLGLLGSCEEKFSRKTKGEAADTDKVELVDKGKAGRNNLTCLLCTFSFNLLTVWFSCWH